MNYKAVIFDLDGTLVNSIKDIADAMNAVLRNRNYPEHDYDTYQRYVGSGIKSLVVKALPAHNPHENEVDECLTEMMHVYSRNCTNKTEVYSGILELLKTLHSNHLKLNILSNKDDTLTKKVVATILPDYFHQVNGLKNEAEKKPNPVVALSICKSLQIEPAQTIFVGDSAIDIQTAKNANMLAVGVSWGYRDKQELIDEGADFILTHPSDLLKILTV